MVIVSHDEYQAKRDNPFHEPLVVTISKRYLPPVIEKYLRELLKTSVLEVVPTDQIRDLCSCGLLKDVSEAQEVTREANVYLHHIFNPRCLVRFGPGDNNLRC